MRGHGASELYSPSTLLLSYLHISSSDSFVERAVFWIAQFFVPLTLTSCFLLYIRFCLALSMISLDVQSLLLRNTLLRTTRHDTNTVLVSAIGKQGKELDLPVINRLQTCPEEARLKLTGILLLSIVSRLRCKSHQSRVNANEIVKLPTLGAQRPRVTVRPHILVAPIDFDQPLHRARRTRPQRC
jgi:hypothetical protein